MVERHDVPGHVRKGNDRPETVVVGEVGDERVSRAKRNADEPIASPGVPRDEAAIAVVLDDGMNAIVAPPPELHPKMTGTFRDRARVVSAALLR